MISPWNPLLPPPLAERALDTACEIARDLASWPVTSRWYRSGEAACLASGLAGRALFFAYLEAACPGQGHGDRAIDLLEQAIERMSSLEMSPALFAGFSGVAWTLEHLQSRILEEGDEDPGEEIAEVVHGVLSRSFQEREYDLLSGVAGLGVYALERRPRLRGEESLRLAVQRLAEISVVAEGGGIAWQTPFEDVAENLRPLFPKGYFAVGVAHGLAGVAAFLASAVEAGVREAVPLLQDAVSWLLAHRLPPDSGAVFPYQVAPGAEPQPSMPGWCWGDPGILTALLGAARRAGEPAWEREAVAMARVAAVRSRVLNNVRDASLCHGSAGLGHLFNRLFQATGEPEFAEAGCYWFERTLQLRRPGEGVGGFLAWDNDDQLNLSWCAEPGFLTGAAGVGLALLAAATPVVPDWDRILLVSIPAAEPARILA